MSPYTKEVLEAQAAHWEAEALRQKKMRILEALVGLVVLGALISFTIWYTAHVQAKGDQRWCTFMVPLDQRYQSLVTTDDPKPDPDAAEFAARLHYLVNHDLNC
jgi:hypothetical protein